MENCMTLEEFLDVHEFEPNELKEHCNQIKDCKLLKLVKDDREHAEQMIGEITPNPIKVLKPKPVRLQIPKINVTSQIKNTMNLSNMVESMVVTQAPEILNIPKVKTVSDVDLNNDILEQKSLSFINAPGIKALGLPPENLLKSRSYYPKISEIHSIYKENTGRYVDQTLQKSYMYDPKPLTRKRRQSHVNKHEKDSKYWAQRKKNNLAARKSREERRQKELEVYHTTNALQMENTSIKQEIFEMLHTTEQLKYEKEQLLKKLNEFRYLNQV